MFALSSTVLEPVLNTVSDEALGSGLYSRTLTRAKSTPASSAYWRLVWVVGFGFFLNSLSSKSTSFFPKRGFTSSGFEAIFDAVITAILGDGPKVVAPWSEKVFRFAGNRGIFPKECSMDSMFGFFWTCTGFRGRQEKASVWRVT
jgi:hypothetical protein